MRMAPWVAPKRPRLLIVDDNAQNVELLTALMQAEGCEVVSAADGLEALAQVAARLLREEVERGWRQRELVATFLGLVEGGGLSEVPRAQ